MLICAHCGASLDSTDDRCPRCKRPTMRSLFAPATEGRIIRPSRKPRLDRGD